MNGSLVFPANQINAIACFNYRKQMGTQEALTGIRDSAPFGIFPLTDSQSTPGQTFHGSAAGWRVELSTGFTKPFCYPKKADAWSWTTTEKQLSANSSIHAQHNLRGLRPASTDKYIQNLGETNCIYFLAQERPMVGEDLLGKSHKFSNGHLIKL